MKKLYTKHITKSSYFVCKTVCVVFICYYFNFKMLLWIGYNYNMKPKLALATLLHPALPLPALLRSTLLCPALQVVIVMELQ